MKFLTAIIFMLSTVSTFAATAKITSFTMARDSSTVAELCGLVQGAATSPSYVKIVIDPTSRRPGTYNTVAGADGKFCLVVVTYDGRAEASLFGEKNKVTATLK